MIDLDELRQHFHLKRFMDKQDLSDVAKETGVSAATLSRFENGKEPTFGNLLKIIKWLGYRIVIERVD